MLINDGDNKTIQRCETGKINMNTNDSNRKLLRREAFKNFANDFSKASAIHYKAESSKSIKIFVEIAPALHVRKN